MAFQYSLIFITQIEWKSKALFLFQTINMPWYLMRPWGEKKYHLPVRRLRGLSLLVTLNTLWFKSWLCQEFWSFGSEGFYLQMMDNQQWAGTLLAFFVLLHHSLPWRKKISYVMWKGGEACVVLLWKLQIPDPFQTSSLGSTVLLCSHLGLAVPLQEWFPCPCQMALRYLLLFSTSERSWCLLHCSVGHQPVLSGEENEVFDFYFFFPTLDFFQ